MPSIVPVGAAPAAAAAAAPPGAEAARSSFHAVLRAHAAPRPAAPAPTLPAGAIVLAAVERAQARLEAVLAAARSGRTFTAQELLGLQAEAYRTTQTVDLAARLVEQGAQAVRQALNTQV